MKSKMFRCIQFPFCCLMLVLMAKVSFAQGGTYFAYPGMQVSVTSNLFNPFFVNDFGIVLANSVIDPSGATASVDVWLRADDINFRYCGCGPNSNGCTTLTTCPNGEFHYGPISIPPQQNIVRNVLYVAVPADRSVWTGTVYVQSTNGVNVVPFPPNQFIASGGASTLDQATYNAWEVPSWNPQATFYSNVIMLPYANYYHNHNFWKQGWNTTIRVTNNSGYGQYYQFKYIVQGHHQACLWVGFAGTTYTSQNFFVQNGRSITVDIPTLFPQNFRTDVEEDSEGVILIYPSSGSVVRTSVSETVAANPTYDPTKLCTP